jgi:hypothetical protein
MDGSETCCAGRMMALCCLCCFAGWASSVSGLAVHSHAAAHSMQAACPCLALSDMQEGPCAEYCLIMLCKAGRLHSRMCRPLLPLEGLTAGLTVCWLCLLPFPPLAMPSLALPRPPGPRCERDHCMIRSTPSFRAGRHYGSFLLIQVLAIVLASAAVCCTALHCALLWYGIL